MDDGRKKALRQLQEDFREGIVVYNIFPNLHKDAGGFLNGVELDEVMAKESNVKQVDKLWTFLLTKRNEDFDRFCTIVEEKCNNPERANNLRQAALLGQCRSSSSQVPQDQPLALRDSPVLRGASAPVMPVPNNGHRDDGRRQPMELLQPAIRDALVPQGQVPPLGDSPVLQVTGAPAPNDGHPYHRMRQPMDSQALAILDAPDPQGDIPSFEEFQAGKERPFARDLYPLDGGMEDVDYGGEEDNDGSTSGSKARPEMSFQGKEGEHLVKVSIWDQAKSAVLCIRPKCQSDEGAGTAFIGEAPHNTWIMLSALHCFLEEDPVSGESEIYLLSEKPEKLDRMIENSQESLLRDRIRRYYYWFCYKEDGEHVQLRGEDFVAEHVRVEHSVRRDIIAFTVDKATIKEKLAKAQREIHPIKLDNVEGASDPQREGENYWCERDAIAFGFPKGGPLSRSGGRIIKYLQPTDKRKERIGYQVRTEGGSSGSPVFVTFGEDKPIVVALHSLSGTKYDKHNYGTLLWPFLQRTYFRED